MKKICTFILSLLIAQYSFAQWPANYDGVMLQAFYWNSYSDSKWTVLTEQADELSKYFNLIWIPNSSWCTDGKSMGYDPVYWFRSKCTFGEKAALKTMITTFKEKGVGMIGDVVLNHKNTSSGWVNFVNETWTHKNAEGTSVTEQIKWSTADICRNDDGGYTNYMGDSIRRSKGEQYGWECTGAYDTGDDFSGFRDLDHTSENVQKNSKLFLEYLMTPQDKGGLGYTGFRLDMVKGYAPRYTKMYNEYAKPEFCVGEFWDGYDAITNWIRGTGFTSAAFDFPLKYKLNEACGGGNWNALNDKGIAGSPEFQRYSVTFIDNHDTYENESRLVGNVLAANAFILAMPGTPCIFLKHWQRYPIAIGNMILARKAAGVTNQSSITEQRSTGNGYILKTQGSKGSILCLCGTPDYDTSGFTCIAVGPNFAYYVSSNITVEGLTPGDDDVEPGQSVTVYVEATTAPRLYAWYGSGMALNGSWPGSSMKETATVNGKTFWKKTFNVLPLNIIFNNGNAGDNNKTADITGLTHDSYFTYDGKKTYTDVTDQYYTPEPAAIPACVKPIEGHLYAYFQGNKDYDTPYIWVWGANDKNYCKNKNWPGDLIEKVGTDGKGHNVYLWDGGELKEGAALPTGVLFSNSSKGDPKTDDFKFNNGGYYNASGFIGVATSDVKSIKVVNNHNAGVTYNLSGQRVGRGYRGLVIQNGKKVMVK